MNPLPLVISPPTPCIHCEGVGWGRILRGADYGSPIFRGQCAPGVAGGHDHSAAALAVSIRLEVIGYIPYYWPTALISVSLTIMALRSTIRVSDGVLCEGGSGLFLLALHLEV